MSQMHGRSTLRHGTLGSTPVPASITRHTAHGSCDICDMPGVAGSVSCNACGAADLLQIDPQFAADALLTVVRRGFP